ncbi:hypothetical protein PG990_001968 [Apiospora arundinis]
MSNNVFPFTAAAFAGRTAQMQAQRQARMQSHPCPRPGCDKVFTSAADLYQHQYRKSHWTCAKCQINFHDGTTLQKHDAERHLPEAELECPGCNSVFQRPSSLMNHIESDRCAVLKPHMIHKARKRRADFAKGLGSLNPANDGDLFLEVDEKDVNADIRPWFQPDRVVRNFVEMNDDDEDLLLMHEPETPKAVTPKDEPDLYLKGINQAPDLLTGDNLAALDRAFDEDHAEQDAGPWASKENQLFPNKIFREIEDENQVIPVDMTKRTEQRVVDPNKPGYNPAVFYEPYFEKYKCPHLRCGKKFDRSGGLTSHLMGPNHRVGGMRISCPYCFKLFVTMTDAIAHIESANKKCQIRGSDLFREFMANVSGGLIDAFMTQPQGIAFNVPKYLVPQNILAELVPSLRPQAEDYRGVVGVSPKSEARQSSGGGYRNVW